MSIERLIATLVQDFELGGRDIAEVFWFITQWQTEEEETPTPQPEERELVLSTVGGGSEIEFKPYQPEEQEF